MKQYWFAKRLLMPDEPRTVWFWDGYKSWYSADQGRTLYPSSFTPTRMLEHNAVYAVIPDPRVPEHLRLQEGL